LETIYAAGHGANHSSALVAHISTFFRVTWYRDGKYAGSCMQTVFLGGAALTSWVGRAPSVSSCSFSKFRNFSLLLLRILSFFKSGGSFPLFPSLVPDVVIHAVKLLYQ